jgi:hypothetical protein
MATSSQPDPSGTHISVRVVANGMIGQVAKVKALEPLTSTGAPSLAEVTEYSETGIMLRVARYMTVGTIVQLHLAGEFLLWKVICCIPKGNCFHLGLELAERR